MITLPDSIRSTSAVEPALGAAYWKSSTARARSLDVITLLNADDPVTFDPVRDYASVENAVALGTKRNPRRSVSFPWERFLDSSSVTTLQHQRAAVDELEVLYENLQSSVILAQLTKEKIQLHRLTSRLMSQALEQRVNAQSERAQDHNLAWEVFSSMKSTHSAVPIPPATLVDHFECVMAPKGNMSASILPGFTPDHGPLPASESDLFAPFSGPELGEAVRLINMDSAPGPDGFTPKLVKDLFSYHCFFVFFLMFVNFCFESAWIPLAWQYAEIFVLYKGKGDPTSPDSYRGIALCCILAKVYEQLLLIRLKRWWKSSSLFFLSQFGFRSGSSTLDAVFVLQYLVNFVCRVNRAPLHATFIDLRKAFPSVSRSALFQRLSDLGVPRPLIAAIRSFYLLNAARLHVGSFLSRYFVVTLGLLEGSILSPLLFSIVFSFVWKVVNPSDFPGIAGAFKLDDVWILAFADDLVVLSPSRSKLEAVLQLLDVEFSKFNLLMNLAKTEVLTFLPRGAHQSTCPIPRPIVIRHHTLTEVESFRYLGVLISRVGSLKGHLELVTQRAKVSAQKTVDLVTQLQITSLARQKCYFLSFVQAQFYGLELLPYSSGLTSNFEQVRNLFLRQLFKLPPGTPSDLFYVLWPSFHPTILCLKRRLSFFQRGLRHDLPCVTTALMCELSLLPRQCGWFHDSFLFYRFLCSDRRAQDFDFATDVPALLELIRTEELYSFSHVRASTGATMSFFRQVRHVVGLQIFRDEFGRLPSPYQHIFLCFATSQMRWTFLATPRRFCPLCAASWQWEHFFSCSEMSGVLAARGLSVSKLRCDVIDSRWAAVFSDVAHLLIVWSFALNRDPNLVLSYDVDVFRDMLVFCRGATPGL